MIKQKKLTELLEKSVTDFLDTVKFGLDGPAKVRALIDHLYWLKGQTVYGFFSIIALSNLSNAVFRDSLLMDMVLDCTHRFSMNVALVGPDEWSNLLEIIITSAADLPAPTGDTAVLIPTDIYNGLYLDPSTLRTLLLSNRWIVWLYLILLYANLPEPILPAK